MSKALLLAVTIALAAAVAATSDVSCPYAAAEAGVLKNDEEFMRVAFEKFQRDNLKVYGSSEATEYRYKLFRANYLRAMQLNDELNERRGTTGLKAHGVTSLMDLSTKEFRSMLTYKPSSTRAPFPTAEPPLQASGDPVMFDWTKVKGVTTAVRTMHSCTAGWAFATANAIEGAFGFKHRNNTADSYLSPQQMIDCDPRGGCGNGDLSNAFHYITQFGGLVSEVAYKWVGYQRACKVRPHDIAVRVRDMEFALEPCFDRTCYGQDEALMSQILSKRGPAAVCVHATDDWQSYTGPEAFSAGCGIEWDQMTHCVTAEALYATGSYPSKIWKVRNQWGPFWGVKGYMLLEYGKNKCGLANEPAIPILG